MGWRETWVVMVPMENTGDIAYGPFHYDEARALAKKFKGAYVRNLRDPSELREAAEA